MSPIISGGGGGGAGTVTQVSSANDSIAVANGTTTPTLTVGTADKLFTNSPPGAAVALNAKKITGLANGTAASDAAAFGQTPAGGNSVTLAQLATVPVITDAPTGALALTIPRWAATSATGALVSGTVYLTSIQLPLGLVITSLTFWSDTAAINGPTHQVFGLYDSSLARLAVTTDDTTTAWAATTAKTLNLTPGTFTTTYNGLHYVAILTTATVAATSVITSQAMRGSTTGPASAAPRAVFAADTAQTALPNPAVFSAVVATKFYAYVS